MEHGEGRPAGPGEDPVTRTFHALRDRLAGTAYFILGDREAARDAVQDAFVRCWAHRHETGTVGNLEAWVFTVLLNAARDARRRRTVRRASSLPAEEALPVQTREIDPAVAAEKNDAVARVRAALLRLPLEEREVFLLRENGDLPFGEIARLTGVPVGTAKSRMRLALHRLRAALGAGERAS